MYIENILLAFLKIYLSALPPPGEYFVYFSRIYIYFFGGTPNSKRRRQVQEATSATTNANAAAASVIRQCRKTSTGEGEGRIRGVGKGSRESRESRRRGGIAGAQHHHHLLPPLVSLTTHPHPDTVVPSLGLDVTAQLPEFQTSGCGGRKYAYLPPSLLPLPRHFIHSPTHPSDTLVTSPSLDVIEQHLELQMKTTVGTQICVPAAHASSPPSLRNHSPFPHLHSPLPPLPRHHPTANGNCQTNSPRHAESRTRPPPRINTLPLRIAGTGHRPRAIFLLHNPLVVHSSPKRPKETAQGTQNRLPGPLPG